MVCVRYINVERQRHFQEFPVIEIKNRNTFTPINMDVTASQVGFCPVWV
jgi:hypothetical protein